MRLPAFVKAINSALGLIESEGAVEGADMVEKIRVHEGEPFTISLQFPLVKRVWLASGNARSHGTHCALPFFFFFFFFFVRL
jgi:hypothetical protein